MNIKLMKKKVYIDIKNSVYKRIFFLALFFVLLQVIIYINNVGYLDIPVSILNFFDVVVFSTIVIIIMSVVLRLTVSKVFHFQEQETEIEQRIFVTKVYSIFLYFLAFAAIMWRMGVSLSNITLFLGIVTTGIAFALRDVILSFIVWIIILTKRPFRINDVIQLGENVGLVSRIGTFYVTLETSRSHDSSIKIPNKLFFDNAILNMGKRLRQHIKISLSDIKKDLAKDIGSVVEYLESSGSEVRTELEYEGIIPVLNIYFSIPFKEMDKKNGMVIRINEILKKHIRKKAA